MPTRARNPQSGFQPQNTTMPTTADISNTANIGNLSNGSDPGKNVLQEISSATANTQPAALPFMHNPKIAKRLRQGAERRTGTAEVIVPTRGCFDKPAQKPQVREGGTMRYVLPDGRTVGPGFFAPNSSGNRNVDAREGGTMRYVLPDGRTVGPGFFAPNSSGNRDVDVREGGTMRYVLPDGRTVGPGFFAPKSPGSRNVDPGMTPRSTGNRNVDPGMTPRSPSNRNVDPGFMPGSQAPFNPDPGILRMPKGCFGNDPGLELNMPQLRRAGLTTEFKNPPKIQLGQLSPGAETTTVNLIQLKSINPEYRSLGDRDASDGKLLEQSFWQFRADSSFVKEIKNVVGFVSTKPIDMGGGFTLPVGTKFADPLGTRPTSMAMIQPGYKPGMKFELPNGQVLSVTKSARSGGSAIKFPNGTEIEMRGAPSFNPTTGKLGWVKMKNSTDGSQASSPSFTLKSTIFDNQTSAEVKKLLEDTLR
jgi:hypothetical protein